MQLLTVQAAWKRIQQKISSDSHPPNSPFAETNVSCVSFQSYFDHKF